MSRNVFRLHAVIARALSQVAASLVRLKSGGPVMRIDHRLRGDWLVCEWIDLSGELRTHAFRAPTLEYVHRDDEVQP